MNKITRSKVFTLVLACLFSMSSVAFAKEHTGSTMPSGFAKGEKKGWGDAQVPPGWSKGEKKGWHGASIPPGLAKKDVKKTKKKVKDESDKSRKKLMNKEA